MDPVSPLSPSSLSQEAASAPIEDMLTLEHLHELKEKLVLGSSSTQGRLTKEQFRELLTVFLQERDLESHFGRMFSKVCPAMGGWVVSEHRY